MTRSILGALLLTLFAGCVPNAPEEVAQRQFRALAAGNLSEYHGYFADEAREVIHEALRARADTVKQEAPAANAAAGARSI